VRSYQEEDAHLLDYGLIQVPSLEAWGRSFRGPLPTGGKFIACVGAAQTFGRLCPAPFPSLVSQELGVDVLNLGHGGAGPELFLRHDFLSALDGSSLVVVQVMSGRSQSTKHFRSDIGLMAGRRVADGKPMVAEEFFEELCRDSPEQVPAVIAEFQRCYERSMIDLINALKPRTVVLFWFSVQRPGRVAMTGSADDVLGAFPHLVSATMIQRISRHADAYVECVTSEGLPRRIVDASGNPSSFILDYRLSDPRTYEVDVDSYYPSPQMHVSAASSLVPVIRSLLADT
jgi:uncharacterized protein DUF6473